MNADIQIVTAPERRPSITQDELAQVAERIRARIRRTTEDIIQTGHDLIQVKAGLEHGEFLDWIETEFSMTDRAARNYMQAARWAEDKSEIVSDLPLTTIYMLASPSTPEPIRERVIADLEAGKKADHCQIEEEIREAKSRIKNEKRAARREQSLSQKSANVRASQRKRERGEAQREREEAEAQAREKQVIEALQEACAILLKLDTSDLDRLFELLNPDTEWGWMRLPKALAHAMRCAAA